jgi:GNAT superfamily N-acetyltransferase
MPSRKNDNLMNMATAPKFRRANVADAAALARVHVQAWHESYPGMVPDAMLENLNVEGRTRAWQTILAPATRRHDSCVYLVERDGADIGFGSCGRQRDLDLEARGFDGEFIALYVLRACQAQGVGAALLRVLAVALLNLGVNGASLWVLKENSRARGFYEHMGGELIGEQEEAREHGVLLEVGYGWRDLKALAQDAERSVV